MTRARVLLALVFATACDSGGVVPPPSDGGHEDTNARPRDAALSPPDAPPPDASSESPVDAATPPPDAGPPTPHDPLGAPEVRAERVFATSEWTDLPTAHEGSLELQIAREAMVRVVDGRTEPVRDGACRGRDAEGFTICVERADDRVSVVRVAGERAETLVEVAAADFPGLANDWVVTADTTVFFTNRCDGYDRCSAAPASVTGSVLRLRDGVLAEAHRGVLHPNGIALAPDGRTLYVAAASYVTARDRRVHAFTIDGDGELSDPRALADVATPDGMAVDPWGNLWIASDRSSVVVMDPSGTTYGRVRLEGRVTNVAIADGLAHFTTDARGVWRFRMEVMP